MRPEAWIKETLPVAALPGYPGHVNPWPLACYEGSSDHFNTRRPRCIPVPCLMKGKGDCLISIYVCLIMVYIDIYLIYEEYTDICSGGGMRCDPQ